MANSPKSYYSIKLFIGETDFSEYLHSVVIQISKDKVFQKVFLEMGMNRIQYKEKVMPYKDMVKLDIVSSKGMENDDSAPDIDASFSYYLAIAEENSDTTNDSIADGVPKPDRVIFTCVQKDQLKLLQETVIDLSFEEKTRKNMVDEIMNGCTYELQSEIVNESEVIDQVMLPPSRRYNAINSIEERLDLFKGAPPNYINFCIDGKVYLGSCITNNLEPIKVLVASEPTDISNASGTISKNNEAYNYTAIAPMKQVANVATTCIGLGKSQKYCFLPMNKVFSRLDKKLSDYDSSNLLSNIYGDDEKTSEYVKKTNNKESWVVMNGMPEVNDPEDNINIANYHIFNQVNQAVSLSMNLEGIIKFEDFLMVGRKVIVTSGMSNDKLNGEYFLDTAVLSFKHTGAHWNGGVSVILKTSLNITKC